MRNISLFLVVLTITISCSSRDTTGVATATAVLVAAPLTPIANAVIDADRVLSVYELYKINERTFVVRNGNGWFTDQSERDINNKDKRYQSAWIIDLDKEVRDKEGKIILSEINLDRWYFKDNDVSQLIELPRNPETPKGEYYISGLGANFITLKIYGESHILFLKQN